MAPALVLMHVRGLPDTSLYHAMRAGGMEHYGWGQDRHIQADLYDALSLNTEATGNWSKPPKLPSWPRPSSESKDAPKKGRSVKDLFFKVQEQRR